MPASGAANLQQSFSIGASGTNATRPVICRTLSVPCQISEQTLGPRPVAMQDIHSVCDRGFDMVGCDSLEIACLTSLSLTVTPVLWRRSAQTDADAVLPSTLIVPGLSVQCTIT